MAAQEEEYPQEEQDQRQAERENAVRRYHALNQRRKNVQQMNKIAKQWLKRLASKGRIVITSLAPAVFGWVSSPVFITGVIIGIIVIILIIIFFFILLGGLSLNGNPQNPIQIPTNIPGLTLQKTGIAGCITDCTVANGQEIIYTLSGSYSGTNDITVWDPIPQNTTFVSATGNYINQNNTITWLLRDNFQPSGGTTKNFSFSLTVRPTQNDIQVVNQASADVVGSPTGNPPSNGTPIPINTGTPNANTCNGVYNLNLNPMRMNFGDPACELAQSSRTPYTINGRTATAVTPQQLLVNLVQQLDLTNARYWIGISYCESGFNPNIANLNSTSGKGAFGLFQMNPTGRGNGPYDTGDVQWQQQTNNAISYNNSVLRPFGLTWRYWACARDVFGLW